MVYASGFSNIDVEGHQKDNRVWTVRGTRHLIRREGITLVLSLNVLSSQTKQIIQFIFFKCFKPLPRLDDTVARCFLSWLLSFFILVSDTHLEAFTSRSSSAHRTPYQIGNLIHCISLGHLVLSCKYWKRPVRTPGTYSKSFTEENKEMTIYSLSKWTAEKLAVMILRRQEDLLLHDVRTYEVTHSRTYPWNKRESELEHFFFCFLTVSARPGW